MEVDKKSRIKKKLFRLFRKEGAFLLEAMIGTAILSIVLVFFATVSVSAFLLMQRAYHETNISEAVFLRVEGRKYTDLTTEAGRKAADTSDITFVYGKDSESNYVNYVAADGSSGTLDVMDVTPVSKPLFARDLYAFRYQDSNGDYTATFYILKGEK